MEDHSGKSVADGGSEFAPAAWLALALFILGIGAGKRLQSDEFARPLGVDELRSARYYTWFGTSPDGSQRRLSRMAELTSRPMPGAKEFVFGLYASAGRWPEPNNHVVHSIVMNFAMLLPVEPVPSIRLSALFGSVLFCFVLATFLARELKAPAAAPLIAALAFWHPYVIEYSQTARGYTWMLALQVGLLVALRSVCRRPADIVPAAGAAILAILTCMNMVSLSLDWVVPVYATMLCAPSLFAADADRTVLLRRNLVCQLLGVGAAVGVFVVDRLPYLYAASIAYGLPIGGWSDVATFAVQLWQLLFPGWIWMAIGAAGAVMWFSRRPTPALRRALAVWGAVIGVSTLHFLIAGKLPYMRVLGFLLPGLLTVVAVLAASVVTITHPFGRRAATLLLTIITAGVVWGNWDRHPKPEEQSYIAFVSKLPDALKKVHPTSPCYPLFLSPPDNERLELYLPPAWLDSEDALPLGSGTSVAVIWRNPTSRAGQSFWQGAGPASHDWSPATWPGAQTLLRQEGWNAVLLDGIAARVGPDTRLPADLAIVFYYPPPQAVAISSLPIESPLRAAGLRYRLIDERYQAKLQIYNRLRGVVLLVRDATESAQVLRTVTALEQEFGGYSVTYMPHDGSGD